MKRLQLSLAAEAHAAQNSEGQAEPERTPGTPQATGWGLLWQPKFTQLTAEGWALPNSGNAGNVALWHPGASWGLLGPPGVQQVTLQAQRQLLGPDQLKPKFAEPTGHCRTS